MPGTLTSKRRRSDCPATNNHDESIDNRNKDKKKRSSYDELKIKGAPLYGQGNRPSFVFDSLNDNGNGNNNDQNVSDNVSDDSMDNHHGDNYSSFLAPPPPLDPRRTALLVVDVQPEYWSDCPAVRKDFPHFPSHMATLLEHVRNQDTKCIIWVRADYSFDKSPWLQQFARLHQGRIPPIVQPNSKWEDFAEPLTSSPNNNNNNNTEEIVMTKTSWSSTSHTQLIQTLKRHNVETVLVCGLITSVCVQHSAFGIFEAGFRTILVTDACADRGRARHEAALALYGDYMYELHTVESIKAQLHLSNKSNNTTTALSTMSSTATVLSDTTDGETEKEYTTNAATAVSTKDSSSIVKHVVLPSPASSDSIATMASCCYLTDESTERE